MADYLSNGGELLTEEPPKWSEIEVSDKYKGLSNTDRRTVFGKWDDYSRKYAKQEGLWDDPDFQTGYIKKADEVSSQFNTWGDLFSDNVKLYHSVRNFLDPAIEFGARMVRGAETGTKGGVSAAYDVASKATEKYRNPYLNKTAQDAKIDIPSLTKQIEDLEGQVAKDFGGAKISNQYSPEAQNLAGLSSKLAKTRNQLAQAQAAAAGVVKEGFAGNLSRASEDLSADWQGKKSEAGEKYKGLIDAAKDSRFVMQLAESVGQSIPGTAASILNPALGLGVMYMQQYDHSKDEYAKKMEEQGKPVDSNQQAQYAHAQAFGQTPFEVVGDVALAGAVKKIFRAIPEGTLEGGVKSFGKWLGEQAKHLIAPAAGEVLITTPAQSLVQDVVSEKYGIQAPTTIGEKLAKIPEQQALALAQTVLMGGAPIGVAGIARSALSADQKTKAIETKLKAEELEQNNAPLTARALAKSTADVLVSEDPDLVSELVDQEAPEGTFVEEPTGDARFAPPAERTPEEALAAVPPTLEPAPFEVISGKEISDLESERGQILRQLEEEFEKPMTKEEALARGHPELEGQVAFNDSPEAEDLRSRLYQINGKIAAISPKISNEQQLQPASNVQPGPLGVSDEGTQQAAIPVEGTIQPAAQPIARPTAEPVLPASQPQPIAQAIPQDVAPALGEVSAVSPGVRQEVIPNEQPTQTVPQAQLLPVPYVRTDESQQFAAGVTDTAVAGQPAAAGPTIQPVAAPAVKPSSQSTASFTPEQNASHQAFIDTEPAPEVPAEAKQFSDWAQKNVPKNRPVVLYNNEGKTAVISPSPKPDRKYQVTFMDQGNEGMSEAFHDIAAQSVDEGVAEAYRRGFTNTQKYKTYERASENREAGEGSASPNLESRVGQRPGELPRSPEEVRGEVPASRGPIEIHAIDRETNSLTKVSVDPTPELLRELKVQEGIYNLLIKCL
jgi:hypothetical protein